MLDTLLNVARNQSLPPKTKSLPEPAVIATRRFLRAFVRYHFPDRRPDAQIPYRAEIAAKAIGIERGTLSGIYTGAKKAGFNVVWGLAHASGASFEEITGLRPPPRPPYPFSAYSTDESVAQAALEEASFDPHERSSGTSRAATPIRPPRR